MGAKFKLLTDGIFLGVIMHKNIDQIYKEIYEDVKKILSENKCYKSNIDGCNHFANDDNQAINQIRQGSIKKLDVYHLYDLIGDIKINTYLEIGSYVGIGYRIINEMFEPKVSYSVDPNIPHRVFNSPRELFIQLNQHLLFKTNMINCYWSEKKDNSINSKYFLNLKLNFDLIFIDANHSYDSVKYDFFECTKILSDQGIILLHDVYSWPGVNKFVSELKNNKNYIVKLSPKTKNFDGFAAIRINNAKNN